MGHGSFRTREVRTAAESSLCENAEAPGSNTFGVNLPVLSCEMRPLHERMTDPAYRARMNERNLSNLGVRSVAIDMSTYFPGHFTTAAGSLVETWFQDILSVALGGGSTAMVGTTVSSATTASSFTPTATTGWAVGMPFRIGAKGDGRCDGQAGVLATVGSPSTSLVALPGTPSGSDVIYAAQVAYHDESTAASLATRRFLLGWPSSPTAGQQFQALGCQLAGIKFNIPLDGGLPTVDWNWIGAYWAENTETIPGAVTIENNFCAPAAGGSLTLQDVGTATRTTKTPAEIELTIDLGLEPMIGTGGAGTYQNIVGWQRTICRPLIRLRLPWESSFATYWRTANQSITAKHILFNANTIDGRSFGFYMPNCIPVGNTPIYPVEQNGQRYLDVTFEGRDSTVTTSELTRSAIRFFTA
jgi:hypothetical protein